MYNKLKKYILNRFTKLYWRSGYSAKWHSRRRVEAQQDFDDFSNSVYINTDTFRFDIVIEIGTGSGSLITMLNKKMLNCGKFIGIDINKQQININKKLYADLDKVEFLHTDIKTYISIHSLNNVLIVAQNTFGYFKDEELKELFSFIFTKIKNVAIVINTSRKNLDIKSSTEREDGIYKVYDHNYIDLLKYAGYEDIKTNTYGQDEDKIIIVSSKRED